jgi:tRNA 2-selenouridine synthase
MRFSDTATVAQLDLFDEVIDVRSPAEFAEDHVPGAGSSPVLSNAERAEIGTLHKQVSPFAARVRGATLIARNIADHVERGFATRPKDWRPLVYCWRGGKRSAAMKHILREIGWQAATLEGGYKAYRREVVAQLESLPKRYRYLVVCGETGSAKSRILEALARHGAQVLDLERLANHRGSVLGESPSSAQPAQKMFESHVWNDLRRFDPALPVYVESESKKVGELHVPDALMAGMRAARCLRIVAPMAARVAFLLGEYDHFVRDRPALEAKLDCLTTLYSRTTIDRWKAQAAAGEWSTFVEDMLVHHYDPAYRRSMDRNFARLAEARAIELDRLTPADIDAAAMRILAADREQAVLHHH